MISIPPFSTILSRLPAIDELPVGFEPSQEFPRFAGKCAPDDETGALGNHSHKTEHEVAFQGGIKEEQIMGARKVDAAGNFVGKYVKNPFFGGGSFL